TDRDDLTFQLFLSAIDSRDRGRVQDALQVALASRSGYETEYRVLWADGSLHWIAGIGRGDYDEAGRCLRMRGIALDITRRKHAEAERQRNLERIRALHEIGMAINSSLDLQTILDTLL